MTDTFRQKLLNWFCSLLVLFSALSMGAASYWSMFAPVPLQREDSSIDGEFLTFTYEWLIVLFILLASALIWHGFDFIHKVREGSKSIISHFSHFPMWFSSHALLCIVSALILSRLLHNSCPPIPTGAQFAFWQACYPRPPEWLSSSFWLALGLTAILTLWKMIVTLHSLRSKRR